MIRKYQDKDEEKLLEVWYSGSQVGHPFLDEDFLERERENIIALYLPNAETWVFELDDVVVGFIALVGNEVGAIFVDSKYQRRGIGGQLMDHARGIRDSLELNVFEENAAGRSFYEKYGFGEVGRGLHEETGHMLLRLRL
ncbi:MAG: GNAT family N-acetyltransferase [Dehalococcoidia bacterium]